MKQKQNLMKNNIKMHEKQYQNESKTKTKSSQKQYQNLTKNNITTNCTKLGKFVINAV